MASLRFDSAVTRREMVVWAVAVVMVITAIVVWAPRETYADSNGGRPVGVEDQAPSAVPEDDSSGAAYSFTNPTNWAFLATGANFPDALGAGAAAGIALGPILLVQRDSIPDATLAELDSLQPQHVMIIGGPAVVSDAVLDAVDALAYTTDVRRLSGSNRFETAAEVSTSFFPTTGYYSRGGFDWSGNLDDGPLGETTLLEILDFQTGDGMLFINAGVDIARDGATGVDPLFCRIDVDGGLWPAAVRWVDIPGEALGMPCSSQLAIVVGAGSHTIEFVVDEVAAGTDLYGGSLWAIYMPFQEQGWRIGPGT